MALIAVLGDRDPRMPAHAALDEACRHATLARPELAFEWVATDALNLDDLGSRFGGLWVAPGSPYRDEPRVIAALRRARETRLPTFGNCGGFQFMVLEFARNVAGRPNAWHEESETGTEAPLIAKLACSLKGQQETVSVRPGTLAAALVGESLVGRYFCSYGVNPAAAEELARAGLVWSSVSQGEPRSLELTDHPFYVGSLFQPALDSSAERPHPFLTAFFQAVVPELREFDHVTPEFARLADELDVELRRREGSLQDTYYGLNRLDGIRDVVVAFRGGRAVACASFKDRGGAVAEVKRVFVQPGERGRGLSKRLMDGLESLARRRGFDVFLVETARSFPEANALYRSLNYAEIPNFPPYEAMPESICYRKHLIPQENSQ